MEGGRQFKREIRILRGREMSRTSPILNTQKHRYIFISISACSVLLLIRVLIGKIIDDDFVRNLTFEK